MSCFYDMNVMPQAPVLTARLLSHVERNDSFASNRTPLPNSSSTNRVRMLSGGAISLPDQRDSNRSKFYSESSDPGLMMRSPSMRKPTTGGIIEEGDFDENVSKNGKKKICTIRLRLDSKYLARIFLNWQIMNPKYIFYSCIMIRQFKLCDPMISNPVWDGDF